MQINCSDVADIHDCKLLTFIFGMSNAPSGFVVIVTLSRRMP